MKYQIILLLCTLLSSCTVGDKPELKKYTDPVSGKEVMMKEYSIGKWNLYTYVEDENAYLMVTRKNEKSNKPIVGIVEPENKLGSVSVFSQDDPGTILVDISKMDGGQELNKLSFTSRGEYTTYHRAILKNKVWKYEEHKINNTSKR